MRTWLKTGTTASQNATCWSAIKAGTPVHVRMIFTDQNITLDDQDISIDGGLIVNDIFNGDTDLVFGKTVCKQVNARILNSSRLDGLSWTGEFLLQMYMTISNTEYTCDIGYFTGEKPKNVTTAQYIDFTAYDRMKWLDELSDDFWSSLTFPKTISQIFTALCTSVGLTEVMDSVPASLSGRSFSESPADMEGYTKRDILGWVAEQCGSYAVISSDGKCTLKWFSDNTAHAITGNEEWSFASADLNPGYTHNELDQMTHNQLDGMTHNDLDGYRGAYAVDHVLVKQLNSDFDIRYPNEYGENIYTITDNPFVIVSTASDITNYVKPIYDRLAAFGGYLPFEMSCLGDPAVEAGDIITVDIGSVTLTVPVFVKTMRWNGDITDEYETTGQVPRPTYSSNAKKEQHLDNKRIRLFVGDNYYDRKSGVEITDEGVSISGSKYVMVEANNTYKWYFNRDGFVLKDNGYANYDYKFRIGEHTGGEPFNAMASVEMYQNNFSLGGETYNYFETWFTTTYRRSANNLTYSRRFVIGAGFAYNDQLPFFSFYPAVTDSILGDSTHGWSRVYSQNICGYTLQNGYGRVQLVPTDHDMQTRFQILTDANHMYCQKAGSSAKDLIFKGSFEGGVLGLSSTESDLNNLTSPGIYWYVFSSSITNKPSTLQNNALAEVIVTKSPDGGQDAVQQTIIYHNEIYNRICFSGTWYSWYKFAGTQV